VSKELPSKKTALKLLTQTSCSNQVIQHCTAVKKLATQIAKVCKKKGLTIDLQLVQIGALLHDIGRSRTHTINHVIVGVEIAESFNLPKSVVSIIGCHAGGGITQEEAEKLGWPIKQYLPKTIEEKIVSYADKRVEGMQIVKIERTIKKLSKELGSTHSTINRVKKLHYEFSSIIGKLETDFTT
jgi:uncharacterized protein